MSDRGRLLRGFAIVALIALAVTLLPGGGNGVDVFVDLLRALFLVALAAGGWRLYYSQQFWLNSLSDLQRGVLYGAIASAVFTLSARQRFDELGGGLLLQVIVLGACAAAVYWVWNESRKYSY